LLVSDGELIKRMKTKKPKIKLRAIIIQHGGDDVKPRTSLARGKKQAKNTFLSTVILI
jgi:hypothetical protein